MLQPQVLDFQHLNNTITFYTATTSIDYKNLTNTLACYTATHRHLKLDMKLNEKHCSSLDGFSTVSEAKVVVLLNSRLLVAAL